MIILDDSEEHHHSSKLSDDAHSVVRSSTPTPSLPSYESSQALQAPRRSLEEEEEQSPESQPQRPTRTWWPKRTNARFRRAILYALVIYFFLTVSVGVPVIVTRLRHHGTDHQDYPFPTISGSSSLIAVGNTAPLLVSSAVGCNGWSEESKTESTLQYVVPLDGLVFLHSNVTYTSNGTTTPGITGSLIVGVNSDPNAIDAIVSVTMRYSDQALRNRTSVCLMNVSNSNGLYLYVPSNLTSNDTLVFNMTFLFPQVPSLQISEFMTMLPHFDQYFTDLSPYVVFDKVSLGGPRSRVEVGNMEATTLAVKTALAAIEGSFNVSDSLVLETVSAPINVNISLYNAGQYREPTFLDVSTGNAALNASVSLYLPPSAPKTSSMPNFMTRFQTFNAPLAVAVSHMQGSAASALQLRGENSVGEALVVVDSKYSGTFDVSTTFADADVLTSNVDDMDELAQFDLNMYNAASTTASAGAGTTSERTIDFDNIETSSLSGWVGTGTRPPTPPPPQKYFDGQGHVEVISTLSPVALLLGP
ncbi:hypothetical protein WOLCODRAFT_122605 [Wolfiporia cocos MD-104 SS10]|uniref:Uncharacterized protein n=1 Tax=Wolfiporia cocos (strain MD-104) TaxID=742152 RepID=A0A2H3JQJ4_WOLCO|nr:hypothetical protein WOLCODRAFT_122605 [Wolfiporia cocos MD-104 SS10]